jgi:hypothetical protein
VDEGLPPPVTDSIPTPPSSQASLPPQSLPDAPVAVIPFIESPEAPPHEPHELYRITVSVAPKHDREGIWILNVTDWPMMIECPLGTVLTILWTTGSNGAFTYSPANPRFLHFGEMLLSPYEPVQIAEGRPSFTITCKHVPF